jgi:hypothetical protein
MLHKIYRRDVITNLLAWLSGGKAGEKKSLDSLKCPVLKA